MPLTIGILNETGPVEKRVALTPASSHSLIKKGYSIKLESNAGLAAHFADELYCNIDTVKTSQDTMKASDIVLFTTPPSLKQIKQLTPYSIIIGLLAPYESSERIEALNKNFITSFSLELLPRTSRAQMMDVLSSQATLAGYKAAIIAANSSQYLFPTMTTAAGTIRPSNILVIGAGIAGLQAIATCNRLGARVTGYDIRPEAQEQIASLGAKALNSAISSSGQGGYAAALTKEQQQDQQTLLSAAIKQANCIITTAAVPGRPAPRIIDQAMVDSMPLNSLIIDLAAANGGNCSLTQPGKDITHNHVTIMGPIKLENTLANDASYFFSNNLCKFIDILLTNPEEKNSINWDDEIIKKTNLTHNGKTTEQHPSLTS